MRPVIRFARRRLARIYGAYVCDRLTSGLHHQDPATGCCLYCHKECS